MDPEFLSRLPLLDTLSLKTLSEIGPLLFHKRVSEGDLIFRQGDLPDNLFILESGVAEAVIAVEGQQVVLAELVAPTFFGGMSTLEQVARSSSIRAKTALKLVAVPHRVLRLINQADPAETSAFYQHCFLVTARRLRTSNDEIASYFRRQQEKQKVAQLEREFSQLLVHDLRSPLLICEGGLRQLLDKKARFGQLTPKQKHILKRSRRSAIFLGRLINEILEVGRSYFVDARSEQTTLRETLRIAIPQSLGGIRGPSLDDVADWDDLEAVIAKLEQEELFVTLDPALLDEPFFVDKVRLVQVIMNLIGNALKHAPGWLALRITCDGKRCHFAVVDRGPGIPEDQRNGIFELYRQAQAKEQGFRRGFGLGLAGASRLVKSLGGSISAQSGDGGVGNKIAFDIPWSPA